MCISVCADAVRGRYHEINGTPCQDRYSVYRVEGVVCAALCDGAGSCEFSHFGAEAVSREFYREMFGQLRKKRYFCSINP